MDVFVEDYNTTVNFPDDTPEAEITRVLGESFPRKTMKMDGVDIPLPSKEEKPAFEQWVKKNKVSDPFHPEQHYDYVSAFRQNMSRGAGDEGHFYDTYKTPGHPTFSNESVYYKPGMKAGRWEGETYIPIPAKQRWGAALQESVMAPIETAQNLFTGLYAWPASKLAGVATLILTGGDVGAAKAVDEGVAQTLTYQPRTNLGQHLSEQVMAPLMPAFEKIEKSSTDIGDFLLNPAAGYLLNIAGQYGMMAGVKKASPHLAEVPKFFRDALDRPEIVPEKAKPVEQVKSEVSQDTGAGKIVEPGASSQAEAAKPVDTGVTEGQPKEATGGLGERGAITLKQEEKPLLHQFPEDIQSRWDAATITEPPRMDVIKGWLDDLKNKITRVYEKLPNTAEFEPLRFELLNLQKFKGIASDKATRMIQDIAIGLDKPLYDLFEKKVVLDDLMVAAKKGMDLPYGFTSERLAVEKILLDETVGKNPEVLSRINKRKAVWDELKAQYSKAMQEIGFDPEGRFVNEDYFHHQVLEYAKTDSVYGAGKKLQTPTSRGFLKKRAGSELDINRDYIRVENEVIAQMMHDIKVAEVIKFVDDTYNIARETKGEVPLGYTEWQPREGNVFYLTDTIPAKIASQLTEGVLSEYGITAADLNKALAVGGKRKQFIIKEEIANTLDNLSKPDGNNAMSKASKYLLRQWKEKIALINPRGILKYNVRNVSGDAAAAFVGNPRGFKKAPRAFKELYNSFYGDGKMTSSLKEFFEMGGFESTLQSLEIKSFGEMDMFKHLYDKKGNLADIPGALWERYWKTARKATDFRESVLRYANYLDFKEQMKADPEGRPQTYAASVPANVLSLGTIEKRAFMLSDDLLGAYDKVGVLGQDLRNHIWPFWSWKEVNFKRNVQLYKNAWAEGKLATTAGTHLGIKAPVMAYYVGKWALRLTAFSALLEVWNRTMFPDEEKKLPQNVQDSAHIVFGKDSEGNTLYFDRLGMLTDFLSNFGLDNVPRQVSDVLNGKMTVKEMAKAMAKSPLNVVVQGLTPLGKIPAELFAGKTSFPDVTKTQIIRDKKLYIAQQLKLSDEYKAIAALPSPGYKKSLGKFLLYSSDPGQAAYFGIMEAKRRFAERNGKEGEGYFVSPKGNALYNYKLSMRYQDAKSAEKYLDQYIALSLASGTAPAKGLMQSMKSMNPLYGMNAMDRAQFLASLDSEERDQLDRAMDYYFKVLGGNK